MITNNPNIKSEEVFIEGDFFNFFAVIDGLELLDLPGYARDRHKSYPTGIYSGHLAADLELHMPRLIQVDEELLKWLKPIIRNDERWGFFVLLRGDMPTFDLNARHAKLLEHFQSWSHIITPYRESWLFRFYDAAVTRGFFEHATEPEIASFLGPCAEILLVAPDLTVGKRQTNHPLHKSPA